MNRQLKVTGFLINIWILWDIIAVFKTTSCNLAIITDENQTPLNQPQSLHIVFYTA